ncbi:MAG TPA: hypothetical protein VK943_19940, partial [Arenibaculum sp.]|nr:hypothetical protein [Arenibaculum sp.]
MSNDKKRGNETPRDRGGEEARIPAATPSTTPGTPGTPPDTPAPGGTEATGPGPDRIEGEK